MSYSTGCAFNLDDMIMNLPFRKLTFTGEDCANVIKDNHRHRLVKKIFRECFKLVIKDIINNNVTFWLPLTGIRKCNMHMKKFQNKDFKNLRKSGKWKDVDFVKSYFTAYQIGFYMLGNRTPRTKLVYLNKELTKIITDNTNKGMPYGDGKTDTYIKDYYNDVHKKFPTIPLLDIKRILNFTWKSLYLHNSYGGDTLITDKEIWCYIGNLRKDPIEHFLYYIKKLSTKLRVLYRRKRIPYNGYYYFALNDVLYDNYLKLKKKRGRPRKNFEYGNVLLYLIEEECKLVEHNKRYIFRIPYVSTIGYTHFIYNLVTGNAELILIREPLKFKDILTCTNDYEIL